VASEADSAAAQEEAADQAPEEAPHIVVDLEEVDVALPEEVEVALEVEEVPAVLVDQEDVEALEDKMEASDLTWLSGGCKKLLVLQ